MKRKRTQSVNQTWCSVCKLWIADNRAQRDQHEMGTKHKAAQAQLIKDIAWKNKSTRISEPDLSEISPVETTTVRKQSAVEQLLEHAVSGNFQTQNGLYRTSDGSEKPFEKVPLSVFTSEETPQIYHSSEADDVDENGFPLSGNATVGAWMPTEDTNNSELESDLKFKNETVEEKAKDSSDTKEPAAIPLNTFKARKSASTKRRRRADV